MDLDTESLLALADEIAPIKKGRHHATLANFLAKICFISGGECWLWRGARDKAGYGLFYGEETKAHRMAWVLFRGPIPQDKKVCHMCDIRRCVNPDHLWLGSQFENVRDMMTKGRNRNVGASGEANGNSKLTEEQVIAMRKLRDMTMVSYINLGKLFGVGAMTAQRICTRKHWTKVL